MQLLWQTDLSASHWSSKTSSPLHPLSSWKWTFKEVPWGTGGKWRHGQEQGSPPGCFRCSASVSPVLLSSSNNALFPSPLPLSRLYLYFTSCFYPPHPPHLFALYLHPYHPQFPSPHPPLYSSVCCLLCPLHSAFPPPSCPSSLPSFSFASSSSSASPHRSSLHSFCRCWRARLPCKLPP